MKTIDDILWLLDNASRLRSPSLKEAETIRVKHLLKADILEICDKYYKKALSEDSLPEEHKHGNKWFLFYLRQELEEYFGEPTSFNGTLTQVAINEEKQTDIREYFK